MARFKIGDRVKVNITKGKIYNKCGVIAGYGKMQQFFGGQCYSMPNWKIKLDCGECICINERYLNPERKGI